MPLQPPQVDLRCVAPAIDDHYGNQSGCRLRGRGAQQRMRSVRTAIHNLMVLEPRRCHCVKGAWAWLVAASSRKLTSVTHRQEKRMRTQNPTGRAAGSVALPGQIWRTRLGNMKKCDLLTIHAHKKLFLIQPTDLKVNNKKIASYFG